MFFFLIVINLLLPHILFTLTTLLDFFASVAALSRLRASMHVSFHQGGLHILEQVTTDGRFHVSNKSFKYNMVEFHCAAKF